MATSLLLYSNRVMRLILYFPSIVLYISLLAGSLKGR